MKVNENHFYSVGNIIELIWNAKLILTSLRNKSLKIQISLKLSIRCWSSIEFFKTDSKDVHLKHRMTFFQKLPIVQKQEHQEPATNMFTHRSFCQQSALGLKSLSRGQINGKRHFFNVPLDEWHGLCSHKRQQRRWTSENMKLTSSYKASISKGLKKVSASSFNDTKIYLKATSNQRLRSGRFQNPRYQRNKALYQKLPAKQFKRKSHQNSPKSLPSRSWSKLKIEKSLIPSITSSKSAAGC